MPVWSKPCQERGATPGQSVLVIGSSPGIGGLKPFLKLPFQETIKESAVSSGFLAVEHTVVSRKSNSQVISVLPMAEQTKMLVGETEPLPVRAAIVAGGTPAIEIVVVNSEPVQECNHDPARSLMVVSASSMRLSRKSIPCSVTAT